MSPFFSTFPLKLQFLMKGLRLYKYEKLCSRKLIDQIFAAKNNSIKSYPLRLIYNISDNQGTPAQFFISVPKRTFHHAVDRVLMRRRIREAYRLNRDLLLPTLRQCNKSVSIAIVFIGDRITDYSIIEAKMKQALTNLASTIADKSK